MEATERKRRVNLEKAMKKRKYFGCEEYGHIVRNCRIKKEKKDATQQSSNRFEVLVRREINVGMLRVGKQVKNRKTILRKEKLKKRRRN